MNESDCENSDDQLTHDISDAALERAAESLPGAALSFPNSPTVSIIFACCGND